VIGYYVHHVGRGHLRHAQSIAAELKQPLTGLSSLPRPAGWRGDWITLARDDEAVHPVDPRAFGQLHWAPRGDTGLRARMAAIARWIETTGPTVLVVDVSVEVAVCARLFGIPVVVMALPGNRSDPAHRLGYSLADKIIAPWPPGLAALDRPLGSWVKRTVHVGGISRFAGRDRPAPAGRGSARVLVLEGTGGAARTDAEIQAAAAATPGHSWRRLGIGSWVADPWETICRADVVVSHAGLGALADIAAARRPAIVFPQPRPHDEQQVTVAALSDAKLAVTAPGWPEPHEWPHYLEQAGRLGGAGWARWCAHDGGARRAAAAITRVAGEVRSCASR